MTTARRDSGGGSWWWDGGAPPAPAAEVQPSVGGFAFGGGLSENDVLRHELAALGGYDAATAAVEAPYNQQRRSFMAQQEVENDLFQLPYPRPRMRWTAELHDQFVKAVDELGGANKATPKAILSLMGVQGLTLYHLKSHLQKFRLGRTGRRLWRKEFIPANYYRRREERLPAMNMEAQGSLMSNAFDGNITNSLEADSYGNLHLLFEPQGAIDNMVVPNASQLVGAAAAVSSSSSATVEQFGGVKPSLLPLFPSQEWSDFLGGESTSPVVLSPPRPVETPPSMDDDYLTSLGYSSDFALIKGHESIRDSMVSGTFFDEVACFSKVDDHDNGIDLTMDGNGKLADYYP